MTDSNDDEFDPTAPDQREIGREMVDESTGLGSVMAHAYRGELGRVDTWRQRLDQTTTWAVTVMAAILTWAFSSPDNPHYILLIGIVVVTVFLGIEARRYRDYDVFRARVRILQENLLATALDPSRGVEHLNWRAELSQDYREPTVKVSMQEALVNRLRRVYLALLGVLLVAWLFRVTAFAAREDWIETAAIARIPGSIVIVVIGVFYAALLVTALWPRERQAKGEFRKETETEGDWKDSDAKDESRNR
ncbi:conserved hypothetical protein (plasmid) [Haloterrigena turkmenica DSM 5511]|uniref:DUF2270 domain-containing protein n=1 Tax=Haloterrigena turkmenica (strain ATCC 51198 / DSM 5511 / JCM 9101 / NCIMB 13204 / VKM B-1734 / 4k) TaxID=543526 RepID=D2S2P8_HALTV|nr:DUF2270 domain-containing protein [Haloterrigena turkmenica]ADB63645.1 conserved hypothetical protein [Haloterrigena turkmenica DSM 5511]